MFEKEDAELADEIRQRMFIFEDIITLDDALFSVIREIDSKDLAKAMKATERSEGTHFPQYIQTLQNATEDLNIWAPLDYER